MVVAAPASADTPTEGNVGMYAMVDGHLIDLEGQFREHDIDLARPTEGSNPNARLINLSQWISCYTFNVRDEVFNLYTHYWDGTGHDVRLKCGEPGGGGWGYRHIEDGHKADWQAKLDQARSKGWRPEAQGVQSWDDLMSGAAASAITWPEKVGTNAVNATKCGITDLYLVDRDRPQLVLMTIRVLASWATNSDRLITAYPTSKSSC
jgi:hypothetical protein